jgi:phosphatidylserine decarboxylase
MVAMSPRSDVADPSPAAPRPTAWHRLLVQEDLNFLLTNRIPRRLATRLVGWFSQLRTGPFTRLTIWLWRRFAPDLDLSESRQQRFASLHECFIRELRPGVRPVDPRPGILVSPCDAIVGANGRVEGDRVYQAKGFPYSLQDLFGDPDLVERYRDGSYVTLRLKSSFYHRFHAPCDGTLRRVVYQSGDTWNVNPIALRRIEALFTKNERAVLQLDPELPGQSIAIVAVAAILVASIRLHCLGTDFDLRRQGNRPLTVDAPCAKGEELGWFQHGSTLLVFATRGYRLLPHLHDGVRIRMGEPLLEHADPDSPSSTSIDPEAR